MPPKAHSGLPITLSERKKDKGEEQLKSNERKKKKKVKKEAWRQTVA